MFTGIVTDIGRIIETELQGDLRARIATRYDVARIDIGASIACDGVCLTVVALGSTPENWFDVQISAQEGRAGTENGPLDDIPVQLVRVFRLPAARSCTSAKA